MLRNLHYCRACQEGARLLHMILFRYFALTLLGMATAATVVLALSAFNRISYRTAGILILLIGTAGAVVSAVVLF